MAVHIDVLASKHHEYGDRASIILLHCNVVALRTLSNRRVERLFAEFEARKRIDP